MVGGPCLFFVVMVLISATVHEQRPTLVIRLVPALEAFQPRQLGERFAKVVITMWAVCRNGSPRAVPDDVTNCEAFVQSKECQIEVRDTV